MSTSRHVSAEEIAALVSGWARMMETSFLMRLATGRVTALPFRRAEHGMLTTLDDMWRVLPAQFSNLSKPPHATVERSMLEDFCANEIDARVPARFGMSAR